MKRFFCLALILFILSTAGAKAQVMIGGNEKPHAGAILDLSQPGRDASEVRGLLLPCVTLRADLSAFVLPGNTSTEILAARGMMVYHVVTNPYKDPVEGIYIWSGTRWHLLLAVR